MVYNNLHESKCSPQPASWPKQREVANELIQKIVLIQQHDAHALHYIYPSGVSHRRKSHWHSAALFMCLTLTTPYKAIIIQFISEPKLMLYSSSHPTESGNGIRDKCQHKPQSGIHHQNLWSSWLFHNQSTSP